MLRTEVDMPDLSEAYFDSIKIPSIGFGFILAYYLLKFYAVLKRKKHIYMIILFSSYLLYLSIYSNIRTQTWYNSETLKYELRELLKQRNAPFSE